MTDRDALIRAINDAPDDDAPRLVFADWLDEHGEPERAEFVRVQVELARLREKPCSWAAGTWVREGFQGGGKLVTEWPGSPPARCCMSFNELAGTGLCRKCEAIDRLEGRELVTSQWDDDRMLRWFGLPAPWTRIVRLSPFDRESRTYPYVIARRGFLDEVRLNADGWMSYGDVILASHPVRVVTFFTWPEPYGDGELSGLHGDPVRRLFTTEELNAALQHGDSLAVNLLRCRWPVVRTWQLSPANPFGNYEVVSSRYMARRPPR